MTRREIIPKHRDAAEAVRLARLRRYFGNHGRGVLVVGNGPSLKNIDYQSIPANPYVFRCNWFFLEDNYYAGQNVDAMFWSVYNAGLHREVAKQVDIRNYQIGNYLFPFYIYDDVPDSSPLRPPFESSYDHWALLSDYPAIARAFMSRPLPTQGMQMIATAAALGFKDIHIVGIDFYADPNARYAYRVPDEIKAYLRPKDYAGGYEQNHELAVDLRFLQIVRETFPNIRLIAHGLHDRYPDLFVEPTPVAGGRSWNVKSPVLAKQGADGEPRGFSSTRLNKVTRRTERVAYVTFATPNFRYGVMALANSLRAVTSIPLIVMVPQGGESVVAGCPNAIPIVVPSIANPNASTLKQKRFLDTYSKLNVFSLTFLDKAVFLDADTIVLKKIDDLFDHESFAAAPDIGLRPSSSGFNSGVFVCKPSRGVYLDMIEKTSQLHSDDGGDQGFLNSYFPNAQILDHHYNVLKRVYNMYPQFLKKDDIKIIHYVGVKPWEYFNETRSEYREVDAKWFGFLTDDQKAMLVADLRSTEINVRAFLRQRYGEDIDQILDERLEEMRIQRLARGRRLIDVADELFETGKIAQAISVSRYAVKRTPQASAHWYRIARGELMNDQLDAASEAIEEAIKQKEDMKYISLRAEIDGKRI